MRVYIASPYLRFADINDDIVGSLRWELGVDVFLPKDINIDAVSALEMKYVADRCYTEIDQREILVFVGPFGLSVATELGYAIALKRKGQRKYIVLYRTTNEDRTTAEAMIMPFLDFVVDSIDDLVALVRDLVEGRTQSACGSPRLEVVKMQGPLPPSRPM